MKVTYARREGRRMCITLGLVKVGRGREKSERKNASPRKNASFSQGGTEGGEKEKELVLF